jgi:hypothetical protein
VDINPVLQDRLKIIGDKTLGEYNLQILDLAEKDLGSSLGTQGTRRRQTNIKQKLKAMHILQNMVSIYLYRNKPKYCCKSQVAHLSILSLRVSY